MTGVGQQRESYSYTAFVNKVEQGAVQQVTIKPEGKAVGTLENGTKFRTRIPVDILETGALQRKLSSHDVTVKATGGGVPWFTVILWILPFLLIIGLFWWIGRRARQSAGGLGGARQDRPVEGQHLRDQQPDHDVRRHRRV